jgi:hypothetical protein
MLGLGSMMSLSTEKQENGLLPSQLAKLLLVTSKMHRTPSSFPVLTSNQSNHSRNALQDDGSSSLVGNEPYIEKESIWMAMSVKMLCDTGMMCFFLQ